MNCFLVKKAGSPEQKYLIVEEIQPEGTFGLNAYSLSTKQFESVNFIELQALSDFAEWEKFCDERVDSIDEFLNQGYLALEKADEENVNKKEMK